MKILKSLFRKKRKSENPITYILFLLHLWLGLIVGLVISFTCVTGAIYVFKSEVEAYSTREYRERNAIAEQEADISVIIDNFTNTYGMPPMYVSIPESKKRNIQVNGGGRGADAIIAFADRETGEITGEANNTVSSFFGEVMKLHRWFSLEKHRDMGKQIVAGCTIVFMFLLLSGVILWFPKKKKKRWHNKFSLRFRYKFKVWNRDVHINLGAIASILLLLIAWTGIYFTYPTVRNATLAPFMTQEERVAEKEKLAQAGGMQHPHHPPKQGNKPKEENKRKEAQPTLPAIDYNEILIRTHSEFPYSGDITLMLPGGRFPGITVRKLNTHNVLGARLFDNISYSDQGEFIEAKSFSSFPSSQKVRMLMKSIHTGEVLGLKSKILYFILALLGGYLPISGYVMWWKRIK